MIKSVTSLLPAEDDILLPMKNNDSDDDDDDDADIDDDGEINRGDNRFRAGRQ